MKKISLFIILLTQRTHNTCTNFNMHWKRIGTFSLSGYVIIVMYSSSPSPLPLSPLPPTKHIYSLITHCESRRILKCMQQCDFHLNLVLYTFTNYITFLCKALALHSQKFNISNLGINNKKVWIGEQNIYLTL